jgi:cytosine/adenosine deaminase-related metal-dependent hydrolase
MSGEPVRDGWVAVEAGRIRALGTAPPRASTDLGRVAILPALVNAHTHIELSYLRGAVPPSARLVDWVRALLARRRAQPDPGAEEIVASARRAIAEARASGTGVIGDVANSTVTVPLLGDAGLCAVVFLELIGFGAGDATERVRAARAALEAAGGGSDVRTSIAPHAPYSVSPALFRAIRSDLDCRPGAVSTVHLGESPEEIEFVAQGTGPWRHLLRDVGAWDETWRPHGGSPVAYLGDLGFLDGRTLAVHGVQFTADDLARLRRLGTTIVSCPRSNQHVGVGAPPLAAFYEAGVPVAFGTDSLASVPDLNLFGELAEARRVAPGVPARRLLQSATLGGARALGVDDIFGSIDAGKRASLIAVHVPDGVPDVEEYLVGGVAPSDVAWIDAPVATT